MPAKAAAASFRGLKLLLHDPSTCLSAIDVSEVFAVFLSALADSRSFRPDKGLSDKNIVSRDCGTRDLPLGGERNIFLSLRRNGPFVKNIFASVHRAISIRIVRICHCLNSRGTTTVSPKCVVKTAQTRKKQEKISHVHHVLPALASPKYWTASFLRTSSLPSSTLSFRINRPRTRKNLSGRASTTCTDVAERSIDSTVSRARIASCLSLAHLARPPSSGQSMP